MQRQILFAAAIASLFCVAFDPAYGQGSASNQLTKWLKRFPQADANKDGVLSPAEARAFRDQFMTNQKRRTKDFAPAPTHEDVRYGPWDRNLLDVWVPESNRPVPLLVYIHGGGFIGGNKEQVRGSGNVQKSLDRDVAFASIQYRFRYPDNGDTSDPQRAGIQDILRDSARAIQYLRYRAEDFNLDPTKIACYGGSAGAGTSIWLAFHDDLADPSSPDPVLRESSRISAAGMLNGQFTYDLEQWDTEFASRGGDLIKTHGTDGKLELHRFFGLDRDDYSGPLGRDLRADCDMRSLISSDDPPVYILTGNPDRPCTNRGIYNHHPLHASLIEDRCQECGVDVVCLLPKTRPKDESRLEENPDVMLNFFFRHLGVADVTEAD